MVTIRYESKNRKTFCKVDTEHNKNNHGEETVRYYIRKTIETVFERSSGRSIPNGPRAHSDRSIQTSGVHSFSHAGPVTRIRAGVGAIIHLK